MTRRSYDQYCGLAHALDVVGERWTLLVVRNLLLGPLRYSDLLRGLPGITTNLLAKRLREMERAGLIERIRESAADRAHAWRLTALGQGLEPAVLALGGWGFHFMDGPHAREMRSVEFLFVALRRRYKGGVTLRVALVVDDVPYRAELTPRRATIVRGADPAADVTLVTRGTVLLDALMRERRGDAIPSGIEVEGPRRLAARFLRAFRTHEVEA